MIRYHLTITIFNPFFQVDWKVWKLNARGKINSVWFYDYDLFFEKLLNDMNLDQINKFKLNLFEWYKQNLSCVKVCQFVDWNILDGWCIPSCNFEVTSDIIAHCVPSRKICDKYFEYDCLREKYYVKSSFIFYLKK